MCKLGDPFAGSPSHSEIMPAHCVGQLQSRFSSFDKHLVHLDPGHDVANYLDQA